MFTSPPALETVEAARAADVPRAPQLPRHMYEPDTRWGLAFLLGSVALYVLPGWAAVVLVQAPLSWPLRLLGLLPLWLLAQQGLHLLGFVGHEGFHLSLHRNKYVSAALGIAGSSLVIFFAQVGVALTHWSHHRRTNRPDDPDVVIFGRHHTLPRRLLLSRVMANRVYCANLLRIAFNRPLPVAYVGPFRRGPLWVLAWLNLVTSLSVLVGYGVLAVRWPLAALVAVGVPHLLGVALSGLRPYLEHAGTGEGPFHEARTYSSPVMTALFVANNFHLEHHLYPSVPCYRLPAVHRQLKAAGFYAAAGVAIEPSFWGALAHARGRSRYPVAGHAGG
jgi:beta-carotene hydroxylase